MTPNTPALAHPALPPRAYATLAVGLLAISFASIFIRYAQQDIPSLVIATGRLTLAALALTPFALARHAGTLRALTRRELGLAALSGALLALHFAAWIASLEYTTVLVSVVLVSTSPLWAALLEWAFLRAHPGPTVLAGLVVALVGGAIIGLSGPGELTSGGSAPLLGGALALVGAVAMAVYLTIGRSLRVRLPLLPYIWLVYGAAALVLLVAVAATRTPVAGYDADGYLWVALLALVPQLVGHSSLNYALRYLSATFVSIITQMEPIGSAVAAFLIFRETPSAGQVLGSLAILAGVLLASVGQRSR